MQRGKSIVAMALVAGLWLLAGCGVARGPVNVNKKWSAPVLQKEFDLFQDILEDAHPGLYWYSTKDSMDARFAHARSLIQDSLNETGFRNVLSYALAGIGCGHTTVRPSARYARATQSRSAFFPLILKLWPDTAFITVNLHRNDSLRLRNTVMHAINGMPIQQVVDTFFQHLSTDGYNTTHKYQVLSNRGGFGNMYGAVLGYKPTYTIEVSDSSGNRRTVTVPMYRVQRDTTQKPPIEPTPARPRRKERRLQAWTAARSMRWDSLQPMAVMEINTFTHHYRLRRFFRQSFKKLRQQQTPNLVIDLRGNGGGMITYSNLLTKYVTAKPFKIADSLYAVRRHSRYGRYRNERLATALFMAFFAHKRRDGLYHFRFFERKYFKPKRGNHYNGDVYLLTGGNTFSAATLLAGALRPQANVTLVGEETGGGAYGNNAWLIPDVTLPQTGVKFRLPLFRLVIDKNAPLNGRGILPEVEALPTTDALRYNSDFKMEAVRRLIRSKGEAAKADILQSSE